MRNITSYTRNRRNKKNWQDSYQRIWFYYHRLFFGRLISSGNKIKAFNKFLTLKAILKKQESLDPYLIFLASMIKITPSVYIKPLKRKGSDQGIPMPITEKKRATLALNWVMRFAKQKNQNVRPADLANLIILSLYDKGPVIAQKKKSYFVGRANRHLLRFYK